MMQTFEYRLFLKDICLISGERTKCSDLKAALEDAGVKGPFSIRARERQERTRSEDAIMIASGACNISGMAHTLIKACREARDEGAIVQDDPAVKLICSQIAYIAGIWDGISSWGRGDMGAALDACRKPEATSTTEG